MADYQHETGTIIGKGGTEIFVQRWRAHRPLASLVIAHGLGEHSGRYGNLINWLSGKRISIYALDHRGHGRSSGKRGHVTSFGDYVDDLAFFINSVIDDNPGLPVFLLGHSMGGVIAMLYALRSQEKLAGLILSSPGLIPTVEAPKYKVACASFLSKYLPSLLVSNELDSNYISHDRHVVANYQNDPLVHDRISARWYTEFIKSAEECLNRSSEIMIPLFVFHGTDDRLVDFTGSIHVFDAASSRDKTKLLLEGLYHETMNEVEYEREKVLAAISKWILERAGKLKKIKSTKVAIKKRGTHGKRNKE
jgi:lysophospholipase